MQNAERTLNPFPSERRGRKSMKQRGKMVLGQLLLCILLFQTIDGAKLKAPAKKWLTIDGGRPEIIANGGYSGFYPGSSLLAYEMAANESLPGTIMYCNLHFTKDNDGFCSSQINLDNTTTISKYDPYGAKTHTINGFEVHGYFGMDYTSKELIDNVYLRQSYYSRTPLYDGLTSFMGPFQIMKIGRERPRLWLNVENDLFYKQFNISAEGFLLGVVKELPEFVSSPEIGFLKSIGGKLDKSKTRLIFTVLRPDEVEPTTEKEYGKLIEDLDMIKTFASGIVVPKEYIWPMDERGYLLPASTLVQDAHKQGLAVYANGFANDFFLSYNYSFDPVREYLQFVDNSEFSVDGVISDFPSTPSEALGCINTDKKAPRVIDALVISHDGSSGDFPGSTDLAYHQAIEDGADIIDCAVQLSKDGVAYCLDRADIRKTTTAQSLFSDRATNITEIQPKEGIFSFDLTWDEFLTLKPQIKSPFHDKVARNPINKHVGKFMTLSEFLELAKKKAVRGVLVSLLNSKYLKTRGLDIVGAVKLALSESTLDSSKQKVMIMSDESSVLAEFKGDENYERVLFMKVNVDAEVARKNANAVLVHRRSIVKTEEYFIVNTTHIIPSLHAANLSVYVNNIRNEFLNLALNYYSDPYAELTNLYHQGVDGFFTDFPRTASTFVRSRCCEEGSEYVIRPILPGLREG